MILKLKESVAALMIGALAMGTGAVLGATEANDWTLVGWNDLGMHCMDDDYSVFSILPPYNTMHAQLIDASGNRVTDPDGITVTYEATPDSQESINTTSAGKTNFWLFVQTLFGASPAVDEGLTGSRMPGSGNSPQPMEWDSGLQWFTAEGVPITPYDNAGLKNYYPMMRLIARDSSGTVLAATDIVLPVSDEMDCRRCHGSGTVAQAQPLAGWVNDPDPVKDYKRNILRLHDDREGGTVLFSSALAAAGYDPAGLEVTIDAGTPILCARCHGSNALPGTGVDDVPPLTQVIHGFHAFVIDPDSGLALEASDNRTACYSCHPGSDTRCLRGAMGHAVGSSGGLSIQCQNCHGSMSTVGSPDRQGWFDEPTCQSCHTGTATDNSGQIRYTSSFSSPGVPREPANTVFATSPDTPAPGLSLYRFSTGHGGLHCEACHGSTHAIFPSSHENDNRQNLQIQGAAGTLADCASCHGTVPETVNEGPHGMHPIGQRWVEDHEDAAKSGDFKATANCQACHGADSRGTVLSRSLTDKTVQTEWGAKDFWKGYQIGCYTCHNGPNSDDRNPNHPPTVSDADGTTAVASSVAINLTANDADGNSLTLRIVTQPRHGLVGLDGRTATYAPDPGFSGSDSFHFAAWDGMADSNLGTASIQVVGDSCSLQCSANASETVILGHAVLFSATVSATGCSGTPSFFWQFGDGSTSSAQNPQHTYGEVGTYAWTLSATLDGVSCASSGSITVNPSDGGGGGSYNYVTVAAHNEGQNDRSWRTDLAVLNLNPTAASVQISFIGDALQSSTTIELQPNTAMEWRDMLTSLFEIDDDAVGAITVVSDQPLLATSRTYVATDGTTIGQFFPAVELSAGVAQGTVVILPNIKRTEEFLTNVGFLNLGDIETRVEIRLFGSDGEQTGGILRRNVPAGGWLQVNDVFVSAGVGDIDLAWATVEVLTPGGVVWPYASLLDRRSGDPVTIGPFAPP